MEDWNAFAQLMHEIQAERNNFRLESHQECFYRGHRNCQYELLPSLHRSMQTRLGEIPEVELNVFWEFRFKARQLYTGMNDDWDVLFHMQHHGVPTRLLDWTTVLGVALYFALLDYERDAEELPCIWLLNPYGWNKKERKVNLLFSPRYLTRDEEYYRSYTYEEVLLDTHPMNWKSPVALHSTQKSERMFAQSGCFTIHGTDPKGMQEFSSRSHLLKRIDIPKLAIPAVRSFLSHTGIGHRQMFPDLDGLAKTVCDRFGLPRRP